MNVPAIALVTLAAAFAPQDPSAASVRPSGIAARINGEIITWDEVDLVLRTIPPEQRTPGLRRDVLKQLAQQTLFLQESKNYNIEITESQVDTALETQRKHSKLSLDDFLRYVNTVENKSISEYRASLRKELTIATLMSRLATEPLRNPNPKLKLMFEFVSPEEMRDYFDQNPAQFKPIRQIDLVFLAWQFQTPEERDEKMRLAESIRRRIKEGTSLYVLAFLYMDTNLWPRKDGKPEPLYKNLEFKDSPFSPRVTKFLYEDLKEGEVSEPVVDGNMVTLFHLQRKIVEKERTFEEAQPFIRRQLESMKRRINQKILLDDLVRRSFVEPPDLFH